MDTVAYIKSRADSLSQTEAQIAKYICKHPQKVSDMTSSALAKELNIAQSTIIKLIQKLGYKGYTELRIELARIPNKTPAQEIHNNISLTDPLELVATKIGMDNQQAIESTCKNINYNTLEQVIVALKNSNKIILLGIGASSLVAQDLAYKLLKLGKCAIHQTDYHSQLSMCATLNRNDTIIAISHSGRSAEVLLAVKEGRNLGATIVVITSNSHTPLTDLADHILFTIAEEGLLRTSAIASRIAQLTIVDVLFLGLIQRETNSLELIERSRRIIRELKG